MSTSTILGFTDLGDRVISQALPSEEDGAHVSLRRPGAVPVCTWYETDRTVAAVRAGAYKRVALQFPDHLLRNAPAVVALLQDGLSGTGARVFVLGDTSFAACCVDEVAAAVRSAFMLCCGTACSGCAAHLVVLLSRSQHLDADFIVHYGHSCLR